MTSTNLSSNPAMVGGLALILATGFLLAKNAPSYGNGLLTVHKLAAVGIIIFVVVRARHAHVDAGLGSLAWATLITGAAAFLTMIGTGGALSAMDHPPAIVGTVHRIVPYLAVALTLTALYLVPTRSS